MAWQATRYVGRSRSPHGEAVVLLCVLCVAVLAFDLCAMSWGMQSLKRQIQCMGYSLVQGLGNSNGQRFRNTQWRQQGRQHSKHQCMNFHKHGHVESKRTHRFKECHTCGSRGHIAAICNNMNNIQRTARTTTVKDLCACCGMSGHVKSDCSKKHMDRRACGKTGHLAALCRGGGGGEAKTTQLPAPKSHAEVVKETHVWKCCLHCVFRNLCPLLFPNH